MRTVKLNLLEEIFVEKLPPIVDEVPSMIHKLEKSFLYGLARDYYCGKGVIVDAGVFLGGSTVCFGAGLSNNPNLKLAKELYGKPIKTYEMARANPGMISFFKRNKIETDIQAGESFESLLRENISPFKDLVELRIGDISQVSWSTDHKIEILFLDVIKGIKINSHILKTFMPYLIPGHSIVIQQDYFFDGLPYINITQEALDPYFDYIGEICTTALFRLKKTIPQDLLDKDPATTMTKTQQLELIEQSRGRTVDRERKFLVDLSKVKFIGQHFGQQEAKASIEEVATQYPDLISPESMLRLRTAYQSAIKYVDGIKN